MDAVDSELSEAMEWVSMVKVRFEHDEAVYKRFLALLDMFSNGRKEMDEVCAEVANLFAGHQDLIDWFFTFVSHSKQVQNPTAPSDDHQVQDKPAPKPDG